MRAQSRARRPLMAGMISSAPETARFLDLLLELVVRIHLEAVGVTILLGPLEQVLLDFLEQAKDLRRHLRHRHADRLALFPWEITPRHDARPLGQIAWPQLDA